MTHSKRWLKEHFTDHYVKAAKEAGYPSRAAYKLLEIQAKDKIIRSGMNIIDLGAAPGGWSMVARDLVGSKGKIIAIDILEMPPIPGVIFIQGDFNDQTVFDEVNKVIHNLEIHMVMSDMAPNLSGQKIIDQPRSMHLVELAWDFAKQTLTPGGTFLAKVFQGAGTDELLRDVKSYCAKVKIRKPQASRARSSEVYILGQGFNR